MRISLATPGCAGGFALPGGGSVVLTRVLQRPLELAYSRVETFHQPPDQHYRPGDEPPAQHAVELRDAARHACFFARLDLRQSLQPARFGERAEAGGARRVFGYGFDECVSCLAMRALPLPLQHLAAANVSDH